MRSKFQALSVILIAFAALGSILVGAAIEESLSAMHCGCNGGPPTGFPPSCMVLPCPNRETLAMESYKIDSPTNATLTILNTGAIAIWFSYYQVSQSNAAQFTYYNWTEPRLDPNVSLNASISIAGAPFTFQSGTSYAVTVVTTRNNPFTFTIWG